MADITDFHARIARIQRGSTMMDDPMVRVAPLPKGTSRALAMLGEILGLPVAALAGIVGGWLALTVAFVALPPLLQREEVVIVLAQLPAIDLGIVAMVLGLLIGILLAFLTGFGRFWHLMTAMAGSQIGFHSAPVVLELTMTWSGLVPPQWMIDAFLR